MDGPIPCRFFITNELFVHVLTDLILNPFLLKFFIISNFQCAHKAKMIRRKQIRLSRHFFVRKDLHIFKFDIFCIIFTNDSIETHSPVVKWQNPIYHGVILAVPGISILIKINVVLISSNFFKP